jgi:hypothetical protein
MNDLAIPLSGVDALHAHFAEWVKFLDAKGLELEAQLAKLEARKARTTDTPQVDARGSGYLELAFGSQAMASEPDSTPISSDAAQVLYVKNELPDKRPGAEDGDQDTSEASEPPQTGNRISSESPIPIHSEESLTSSDGYMV